MGRTHLITAKTGEDGRSTRVSVEKKAFELEPVMAANSKVVGVQVGVTACL